MTATVALALDDPVVAPGEDVHVTVSVSGEGAQALRVVLFYTNEYLRPGASTSGQASGGESFVELATDLAVEATDGPAEQHEAIVVVASAGHTAAEGPVAGEHRLRLPVPDDAPSSAGSLVRWQVRATLEGGDASPAQAVADVVVAMTPEAGAATLDTSVRWDEGFAFVFPGGQAVRAGQTLSGTLVVTPPKAMSVTEIRIDARGTRADLGGIKREQTIATTVVAGKSKLDQGSRHEFPFTLPIPADTLPDFNAENNRNYHVLIVSGARRMRGDLMAATELFVARAQ